MDDTSTTLEGMKTPPRGSSGGCGGLDGIGPAGGGHPPIEVAGGALQDAAAGESVSRSVPEAPTPSCPLRRESH